MTIEPHLGKLVARYNRPGPRYTSYPTAPQWRETVGAAQFVEQLKKPSPALPISLYLHIPFCKEICYFCGCNTFQMKDAAYADRYLDNLIREIELTASYLERPRQVVQMHWGGGTPTFLSEKQIDRLVGAVRSHFEFTADAEIAIELDPRVTSENQTRLLRKLGFNRVSFGVQDNDPAVQLASNRVQPMEITQRLYDLCRELKFQSINFDLIYGLPKQTAESFAKTIDAVLLCRPERIALFSYAHVPWLKAFQRKIDATQLPDPETKFSTFLMSRRRFLDAGYETIGMDHFALPNDELAIARRNLKLRRNFQGYTVKPESRVYAMGVSSISDLGDLYVQNTKKFNLYYDAMARGEFATERGYHLTANDQQRRRLIMELMCNSQVSLASIENRFNIKFADAFSTELKELEPMIADGLVTVSQSEISLTPIGQLFVRNICMVFDDHLRANAEPTDQKFSKTV